MFECVQDDFGKIIENWWSIVSQMLNDCCALVGGSQDNLSTTVTNIYINYSTIVGQSLDYCSMFIEFNDKFRKTS